jgi:hypothetical protein
VADAPSPETREELIRRLLDPELTLQEASLILNLSKATLRRYTDQGKLRCTRDRGRTPALPAVRSAGSWWREGSRDRPPRRGRVRVGRGVCVDACVGKAAVGEEDRGPQRSLCDVWGGLAVGMFTDSYRPRLSGVVHSVASVARALREQGHRVVVFAPRHPDYQDQEPDVVRLPALSNRRHPDFPLLLPVVRGLDRLVNELGLQVVHTHSPFTAGRLAEASRGPRPLVFTHHTLYEEYVHYAPLVPRSWARRWVRGRVVRFCNRCDLVVAPTGGGAGPLTVPRRAVPGGGGPHRGPGPRGGGTGCPRRIPVSAGVPDGAPLAVCAGRMAPEKSMDTVLQAFAATPALREGLLGDGGGRAEPGAPQEGWPKTWTWRPGYGSRGPCRGSRWWAG